MEENGGIQGRAGQPTTCTVTAAGMTLTGASISAYTTFVCVKDLNTVFDIGSVTEEMLSYDNVLVSHCHADHLLGLTRYTSLRRLQRMNPPTVAVPAEMAGKVQSLLELWADLETAGKGTPPPVNLVPAVLGLAIQLGARRIARTLLCRAHYDPVGGVHDLPVLPQAAAAVQERIRQGDCRVAEARRCGQ